MAASGRSTKAGRTAPPKDAVRSRDLPPGTPASGSAGPVRSQADVEAERRLAQPVQMSGPGSGNRLLSAPDENGEQAEVNVTELADPHADPLVVVGADVYEEVPAPGAPGRFIQQLLYPKGTTVKKSLIDKHDAAQRKARQAAEDAEQAKKPRRQKDDDPGE